MIVIIAVSAGFLRDVDVRVVAGVIAVEVVVVVVVVVMVVVLAGFCGVCRRRTSYW